MKDKCFEAETIQAFLDGELPNDSLENIARHVSSCENCSLVLSEIEEESALTFALLDVELNSLVPTERIRASVYQAIAEIEQPKVTLWQRIFSFTSGFSHPSVAAFASLVIAAGFFAAVYLVKNQSVEAPGNAEVAHTELQIEKPVKSPVLIPENTASPEFTHSNSSGDVLTKVSYRTQAKSKPVTKKTVIKNEDLINSLPQARAQENIEGEATYLKTITTLENTVKDKKDSVLRASSRVSYERDMAVVNDSIQRMKAEIKKNPKNEAARQILRNAYQNKIELLNSISEKSELMASLD